MIKIKTITPKQICVARLKKQKGKPNRKIFLQDLLCRFCFFDIDDHFWFSADFSNTRKRMHIFQLFRGHFEKQGKMQNISE